MIDYVSTSLSKRKNRFFHFSACSSTVLLASFMRSGWILVTSHGLVRASTQQEALGSLKTFDLCNSLLATGIERCPNPVAVLLQGGKFLSVGVERGIQTV